MSNNILLVCASYGGGGAERVALNLGSELCQQGNNVSFYYWDEKGEESYSVDPRIHLKKAPKRQLLLRISYLRKLLKKEAYNVVIGFTDMPNIICYGALFHQGRNPAFIATVHNDLRIRDKNINLSWKIRLLKLLHRRACLFAHKVVVVSDSAKKSLINYYQLPDSAVTRIYNPVLDNVRVANYKFKTELPLKLVAAGRLTHQKNYPLMIRAVKLLVEKYHTPCHLTIYGEGGLRTQLTDLIDKMGMKSTITLHEFVSDLTERLPNNDIFLMTSNWEGFGNVLVEALYAGLRIVACDCPSGPREILANGKYGLLVPLNDAEKMAQAILTAAERSTVQNNIELQQHLVQFTNKFIAKEYSTLIIHVTTQNKK